MPYSAYDYDRMKAARTMKIDRTVYFETTAEDIAPLAALPLAELQKQREESAAVEQTIYEELKKQAAAWEQQAGNTALLDRAITYVRTPAAEHTSNVWKKTDYEWNTRSNMVYQMRYHIYENTHYDRDRQESIPYSWSLTWNVRTNDPDGRGSARIAGQDRKTFADKAAMEKYLAGRIKAYDHLFTEISPQVPKKYAEHFKVNGLLLSGYTIEGEETEQRKLPEKENDMTAVSAEIPPAAATVTPQPVIPLVLTSSDPKERMKEITDRLEKGISELFDSDRYKEYLSVMSKFHNYSINNSLLIAFQKPDASLVAGFTAWQKQFERNVKKGEKGIKIIAPAPFKVKQEKEKLDPATRQPVIGRDGKPVMEEQEVTIPAYKVVSVFDVSQTEGKELSNISVDSLTGNVEHFKEVLAALEKTSPVAISFEDIAGGAHGYYSLKDKRIAIQEGMSQLQTLKTAIHEIAHAKLHDIDLNAPKEERENRPDQRTREVQAESVAYTVCQHYGLDTSDYSFGYVAGWSSGREMAELKASLETIRTAAAEIINSVDEKISEMQKDQEKAQEKPLTPDELTTGEKIETPRGSFHVTAMSREQMEAAGYGFHHQSEDGKYYIMGNGTQAFAVPAQEAQPLQDTFTIYQLKREDATRDFRFEPYDRLQAAGRAVDPAHYDPVYTAPLTPGMTLEDIYTRFNIDHLKDFKGHSLSISDVVVLSQNGQTSAHYVDSIVYKQVPEFLQPENYLKNAELSTEQNFNMIDGIVNNAPTVGELEAKAKAGEVISLTDLATAIQTEKGQGRGREEKPSIRAQLKQCKEQTAERKKTAKTKSHEMEV